MGEQKKKQTGKSLDAVRELYFSKIGRSSKKGITLIALIITIIVLLILAGVSLNFAIGENGILGKAEKTKIMSEFSKYKEEMTLYQMEKTTENIDYLPESLTAGQTALSYNTKPESETGNIKTVIPQLSKKYEKQFEIIKGELYINTKDKNEIEIAKSLGIVPNPYDIVNGVLLSSNGNLLLMDANGTVTIPDSVTEIGQGAFANLSGLKTIIIPGSVKKIDKNAFQSNSTLERVIMEEGVEEIGDTAFYYCAKLKEAQLPHSLKSIGVMGFSSCHSLEEIIIPEKVTTLSNETFIYGGLKNVSLPDGLQSIQDNVFRECPLTEVSIPSTVTNISSSAFADCKKLSEIHLNQNQNFVYENGMLMPNNKESVLFVSSAQLSNTDTLTIPDGVKEFTTGIGETNNIVKIKIPASLEKIGSASNFPKTISTIIVDSGNSTFVSENGILYEKNTKKLLMCYSKDSNITIQEGILALGEGSFFQAVNATNVVLPDSLKSIGANVFRYSPKIQSLKIGKNVSYIHPYFKYMQFSGTVSMDSANPYYMIKDNILYSKDGTTMYNVMYRIYGRFTVDSSVKKIRISFQGQTKMTELVISEGVEDIGDLIVMGSGVTKIEIPSSVTKIGSSAFSTTSNLDHLIIHKPKDSISGAPWGATKGMKVVQWDE